MHFVNKMLDKYFDYARILRKLIAGVLQSKKCSIKKFKKMKSLKSFFTVATMFALMLAFSIPSSAGNYCWPYGNGGNGNGNGNGGNGNGNGNGGNEETPTGACALTNMSDQTDFQWQMSVDNYIETITNPGAYCFGTTTHAGSKSQTGSEQLIGTEYFTNFAYANCPFKATITGDNAKGEGKPRFARQETGIHGGSWDVLPTAWMIQFGTNGEWDYFGTTLGGKLYAGEFGQSENYVEAPHNGQVALKVKALVNTEAEPSDKGNVPVRQTSITTQSASNISSADAGLYKCTMRIVLTSQF